MTSPRLALLLLAAAVVWPAAGRAEDEVPEAPAAKPWKKIEFASEDGLKITADLYLAHEDLRRPFLVLCHQARWSRGEYREIAPKLNKLGYNCLAIDQRSGRGVNEVPNETCARALAAKKGTSYLDARRDIVAALKYAREHYAKGKLVAWGSSYSAALVLQIVGTDGKLADGVMSFAPGEYFGRLGKNEVWVREAAAKLACPVFITSAKGEAPQWRAIFEAIPDGKKVSYLPETAGQHGSRALWERMPDHEGYWTAVKAFLKNHFPMPEKPAPDPDGEDGPEEVPGADDEDGDG